MKKVKIYNFLLWVTGFALALIWRYLLKDIYIPEFFKWLTGIIVIIILIIIINRIISSKNNYIK